MELYGKPDLEDAEKDSTGNYYKEISIVVRAKDTLD